MPSIEYRHRQDLFVFISDLAFNWFFSVPPGHSGPMNVNFSFACPPLHSLSLSNYLSISLSLSLSLSPGGQQLDKFSWGKSN